MIFHKMSPRTHHNYLLFKITVIQEYNHPEGHAPPTYVMLLFFARVLGFNISNNHKVICSLSPRSKPILLLVFFFDFKKDIIFATPSCSTKLYSNKMPSQTFS